MPLARIFFWAATASGIAFTARAVIAQPPPLYVSIACACVYFALLAMGTVRLSWRMFADAVVHGPVGSSGVVLTIEGSLEPLRTRAILDVLDAHQAQATFFVLGQNAEAQREVLEEIVRRGHDVGVQGFQRDHVLVLRGAKRIKSDLERAIRVIENITDKPPIGFRPPHGFTNPRMARVVDQLDLPFVGWSAQPGNTDSLADGAIVRLSLDATGVRRALEKMASRNLRVQKLADWLGDA